MPRPGRQPTGAHPAVRAIPLWTLRHRLHVKRLVKKDSCLVWTYPMRGCRDNIGSAVNAYVACHRRVDGANQIAGMDVIA